MAYFAHAVNNKKHVVAKFIPIGVKVYVENAASYDDFIVTSVSQFNSEVQNTKAASAADIGPKFHAHFKCSAWDSDNKKQAEVGIIVSDYAGASLQIAMRDPVMKASMLKHAEHVKKLLKEVLKRSKNFLHKDLHEGNITIQFDKKMIPERMYLIDFSDFVDIRKPGVKKAAKSKQKKVEQRVIKLVDDFLISGEVDDPGATVPYRSS